MKCGGCNRTVYFLASDLEKIIGGDHYAHVPPFECSRCRTEEFVMMAIHHPSAEDIGHIVVRRPGPPVLRWYNAKLGDPLR